MFSKPITWLALSAAAAVAAIAFAAWSLTSPKPTTASPAVPSGLAADIVIPPKSQAAPDFALTDQNGQTVTVSGLKGKVVATNVAPEGRPSTRNA